VSDKNKKAITPTQTGLSGPTRFLVTAAAFVVVVAGMKAAVDIIVPFLMAIFLAIISTPALFWLKKKGLSALLAILVVSLVILLAGLLFGTVLTTSIADFTQDLPQYTNKLDDELRKMERQWNTWLDKQRLPFQNQNEDSQEPVNGQAASPGVESETELEPVSDVSEQLNEQAKAKVKAEAQAKAEEENPLAYKIAKSMVKDDDPNAAEGQETIEAIQTPDAALDEKDPLSITRLLGTGGGVKLMADLLSQLGSIMADGLLIYLTMVFILLEASILPGKIQAAMKGSRETFDNLVGIAGDVKKYLALKTAISLATGVIITIWLGILGVKYAMLWGLIAFLLNFVPNIGSIIAAIPACALALVQLGLGSAALAALGYIVVNMVIGNFIEPRLMGRRLGLSTLVVFLSLVFWGWVLGPMGMLLSVPLTMTIKIILQSHPDTKTFAILLGSQNPPPGKP
jgi:predicted PurR-regulated permease PerM